MRTSLGDLVRARRTALKLTQTQLAKKAGLSQATISDIERGRNVTSREILKLAAGLEMRAESLLQQEPAAAIVEQLPAAYSANWPEAALAKRIERLSADQLDTLTGIVEDFVTRSESKTKRKFA